MADSPLRIGVTTELNERAGVRLREIAPAAEIVLLDRRGDWSADPTNLDGFFFSEDLYYLQKSVESFVELLDASPPNWMQTASTGVDHSVYASLLESGSIVTNAPGVHAGPIAEYVFAYILNHAKQLPEHAVNHAERAWAPLESVELAGQTLGIVGYGGIGEACARLARAFGMRTLATKRRQPDDANLDQHFPPDRLHELLAASDYVVLCCPLTDETLDLIDAEALAAMQPHALLINVARGRVVDVDALADALESGSIAAAVLDVAPLEPLTADSPLWDLPNCRITPHDSCHVDSSYMRTAEYFFTNLAHLANAEPLEWVVTDIELSDPSIGDV
ncbi:MAG: D-2-hydroxyacid dehydrogenase [Chloroflexota bacterium]|nr:D-2-hydroxyacid dehydrogenase [Chloroflexota bacterium]